MKGIILAGGSGTRLFPLTKSISKQILPVYDKPMIYYPLSVLMLANIKDILIISTPRDILLFENLLGDGKQLGINIEYKIQNEPNGIAECFLIGEDFIDCDNVTLILGDNIFYGAGMRMQLLEAAQAKSGATVFGYHVEDPERFGVVEFDESGLVKSIEEKPECPKSNYAVTGLYFYDRDVCTLAKKVTPSKRGELEITDLNKMYLERGDLRVHTLGRGYSWLDTGTVDSLSDASEFVRVIQTRSGIEISALEELAYRNEWITKEQLLVSAELYGKSPYGKHLRRVAEGQIQG